MHLSSIRFSRLELNYRGQRCLTPSVLTTPSVLAPAGWGSYDEMAFRGYYPEHRRQHRQRPNLD